MFAKLGSHCRRLDRAKKQISFRLLHVQRAIRSDRFLVAIEQGQTAHFVAISAPY